MLIGTLSQSQRSRRRDTTWPKGPENRLHLPDLRMFADQAARNLPAREPDATVEARAGTDSGRVHSPWRTRETTPATPPGPSEQTGEAARDRRSRPATASLDRRRRLTLGPGLKPPAGRHRHGRSSARHSGHRHREQRWIRGTVRVIESEPCLVITLSPRKCAIMPICPKGATPVRAPDGRRGGTIPGVGHLLDPVQRQVHGCHGDHSRGKPPLLRRLRRA